MYARVVQVALQPGHIEEAVTYFRDSVAPALKQLNGFKNSRLLTNSTTNQCLMVTLWESEKDRESAGASSVLQRVLTDMRTYFAGTPTIDYYEVSVQVV